MLIYVMIGTMRNLQTESAKEVGKSCEEFCIWETTQRLLATANKRERRNPKLPDGLALHLGRRYSSLNTVTLQLEKRFLE